MLGPGSCLQIHRKSKQVGLWGNVRLPRKQVCSVIPTQLHHVIPTEIELYQCLHVYMNTMSWIFNPASACFVRLLVTLHLEPLRSFEFRYVVLYKETVGARFLHLAWDKDVAHERDELLPLEISLPNNGNCSIVSLHETIAWFVQNPAEHGMSQLINGNHIQQWIVLLISQDVEESTGNSISCLSKNCGLGVKDCFFSMLKACFFCTIKCFLPSILPLNIVERK